MNLNVKITPKTKTIEMMPILFNEEYPERAKAFIEEVEEVPIGKNILEMTIAEFKEASSDTYYQKYFCEKYLVNALGKYKCYLRQMEEVQRLFQLYSIDKSDEEEMAMKGVNFLDPFTSMMDDCVSKFGLKSYAEAQDCLLSDWLIIAKKRKAEDDYANNLHEIQNQKQHHES